MFDSQLVQVDESSGEVGCCVDCRDRRLIHRLYKNQSVVKRINSLHSDACQLGRGVRQGCPLSPLLFNTYMQQLIAEALENTEDGVKVNGLLVKAVRFADDQPMVSKWK